MAGERREPAGAGRAVASGCGCRVGVQRLVRTSSGAAGAQLTEHRVRALPLRPYDAGTCCLCRLSARGAQRPCAAPPAPGVLRGPGAGVQRVGRRPLGSRHRRGGGVGHDGFALHRTGLWLPHVVAPVWRASDPQQAGGHRLQLCGCRAGGCQRGTAGGGSRRGRDRSRLGLWPHVCPHGRAEQANRGQVSPFGSRVLLLAHGGRRTGAARAGLR